MFKNKEIMEGIKRLLKNRIRVSACKYGDLVSSKMDVRNERNEWKNVKYRLGLGKRSGNMEYVVDAVNFAMFESMEMRGMFMNKEDRGVWGSYDSVEVVKRTMDMDWLDKRIEGAMDDNRIMNACWFKVESRVRKYEKSGDLDMLNECVEYMIALVYEGEIIDTDEDVNSKIV